MIEKQPKEITPISLEGILMPNGEVISKGVTIGKFEDFKEFLNKRK